MNIMTLWCVVYSIMVSQVSHMIEKVVMVVHSGSVDRWCVLWCIFRSFRRVWSMCALACFLFSVCVLWSLLCVGFAVVR